MTTFNELVADLVRENLLDENIAFSAPTKNISPVTEIPDSIELLKQSTPDLLALAEKHEFSLPEFSFLEPENVAETFEENRDRSILPTPAPQTTFHSTQQFLTYQNRRRRSATRKIGSKICRSCTRPMPFYHLNCPVCNGTMTGNLFYYLMLTFAGVFVTLLTLLILSTKTYK